MLGFSFRQRPTQKRIPYCRTRLTLELLEDRIHPSANPIIAENQQWFQQKLRPPMTEQWFPRCPPHLNGLKETRSPIHHDHFAR